MWTGGFISLSDDWVLSLGCGCLSLTEPTPRVPPVMFLVRPVPEILFASFARGVRGLLGPRPSDLVGPTAEVAPGT
jgi:hypothetical protein